MHGKGPSMTVPRLSPAGEDFNKLPPLFSRTSTFWQPVIADLVKKHDSRAWLPITHLALHYSLIHYIGKGVSDQLWISDSSEVNI